MTPDEFAALVRGPRANLLIRCGAENGGCGKVRWLALDDDTMIPNPKPCGHEVVIAYAEKGEFRRLNDVFDWTQEARAARQKAVRSGRRFRPVQKVKRPRPGRLRRQSDEIIEEEWAMFNAEGERSK